MTEQEAREGWCPFANGGARQNREAFGNCIASRCMAWRWEGDAVEFKSTNNVIEYDDHMRTSGEPPAPPPGEGWEKVGEHPVLYPGNMIHGNGTAYEWQRPAENRRGYCGLAGKP